MTRFFGGLQSWVAALAIGGAVLAGGVLPGCADDGGGGSKKFGNTACVQCALNECGTELAACEAEADCDAALSCVFDCPADGNQPESDCADECPTPTTPAGGTAYDDVLNCYINAAGGTCANDCS